MAAFRRVFEAIVAAVLGGAILSFIIGLGPFWDAPLFIFEKFDDPYFMWGAVRVFLGLNLVLSLSNLTVYFTPTVVNRLVAAQNTTLKKEVNELTAQRDRLQRKVEILEALRDGEGNI